jgi:glycosyltransferase involved in cell wall biosynthesis
VAERSLVMTAALHYDALKAKRLERISNTQADGLTVHTSEDGKAFSAYASTPSIVLMPGYDGRKLKFRKIDSGVPPRITIMGNHDSYHKRMVLVRALEALKAGGLRGDFLIDIVGGGDHQQFARRFPNFNFLGFVDDLEGYMASVRIGLIPDLIGGGFKNRALAYAFNRVPILAVEGAMAGMGFKAGEHYKNEANLEDLVREIPSLIQNFEGLNDLQNSAFEHCENAFDWKERGKALHEFAQELIHSS